MASPAVSPGGQRLSTSRRVYDLPELRRRIFDALPSISVAELMVINRAGLWTAMDICCEREPSNAMAKESRSWHSDNAAINGDGSSSNILIKKYAETLRRSVRVMEDTQLIRDRECQHEVKENAMITPVLHFCDIEKRICRYPSLRMVTGSIDLQDRTMAPDKCRWWDEGMGRKRKITWEMDVVSRTVTIIESTQLKDEHGKLRLPVPITGDVTCTTWTVKHEFTAELHITKTDITAEFTAAVASLCRDPRVVRLDILDKCYSGEAGLADIPTLAASALSTRKELGIPFEGMQVQSRYKNLKACASLVDKLAGGTTLLQLDGSMNLSELTSLKTPHMSCSAMLWEDAVRTSDDNSKSYIAGHSAFKLDPRCLRGQETLLADPMPTRGDLGAFGQRLRVLSLSVKPWRCPDGCCSTSGVQWTTFDLVDLAGVINICKTSLPNLKILHLSVSGDDDLRQDGDIPVAKGRWGGSLTDLVISVKTSTTGSPYRHGVPVFALAQNVASLCDQRTDIKFIDASIDEKLDGDWKLKVDSRSFHHLIDWMLQYVQSLSKSVGDVLNTARLDDRQQSALQQSTGRHLGLDRLHAEPYLWRRLRFDDLDRPIPIHLVDMVAQLRSARHECQESSPGSDESKILLEQFEYLMKED